MDRARAQNACFSVPDRAAARGKRALGTHHLVQAVLYCGPHIMSSSQQAVLYRAPHLVQAVLYRVPLTIHLARQSPQYRLLRTVQLPPGGSQVIIQRYAGGGLHVPAQWAGQGQGWRGWAQGAFGRAWPGLAATRRHAI